MLIKYFDEKNFKAVLTDGENFKLNYFDGFLAFFEAALGRESLDWWTVCMVSQKYSYPVTLIIYKF
jgi:hypothetical protein